MTIDEKNILWLDVFEFLTYNKKEKLLKVVGKNNDIRKEFLKNPAIKEILNEQEFKKMAVCLEDLFLERVLEDYRTSNVECVTFYDKRYPYILKEISTPPFCLYCKGNIQLLNSFCIGIVGSRKPSEYGLVVTKQYAKALATNGVTVVSGLAIGVDTISHKTTIEEAGNTIAVLGGGFKHIYPAININLANKITENNLLVSEYAPNTTPQTYYFPARNRIIAGLSRAVVLTEAGIKSGALKTADYAIEYNRDIFIVPGRINSETSKGTNNLIKNLQGSITLDPSDILELYGIETNNKTKNLAIQLDMDNQIILDYIKTDKKSFQEIADYTKIPIKELNSILLELEMDGTIIKLAGNCYIKSQ